MMHQPKRGFTLVEIIVVCAIACIVLAIAGIYWHRASANRQLDATTAAFQATFMLARQTAQNRHGAKVVIELPTGDIDGNWKACPAGDANEIISSGIIPKTLNVVPDPSDNTVFYFDQSGNINIDQTKVDKKGNCNFLFEVRNSDKKQLVTIVGATGAVIKSNL